MKPYTYYLFHRPTNKHYYGVRFAKNCTPDELWKTYFTSSKVVHQLIKDYGKDSFDFQIRKTFDTASLALDWECKFLTRMDAANNDMWINRHNGKKNFRCPIIFSEETKRKISKKSKGRKFSEEHKEKLRLKSFEREKNKKKNGWKMPKSSIEQMLNTRNKKMEQGLINPYSTERNKKMSESKKGTKRKYLPDGSFIMIKN